MADDFTKYLRQYDDDWEDVSDAAFHAMSRGELIRYYSRRSDAVARRAVQVALRDYKARRDLEEHERHPDTIESVRVYAWAEAGKATRKDGKFVVPNGWPTGIDPKGFVRAQFQADWDALSEATGVVAPRATNKWVKALHEKLNGPE